MPSTRSAPMRSITSGVCPPSSRHWEADTPKRRPKVLEKACRLAKPQEKAVSVMLISGLLRIREAAFSTRYPLNVLEEGLPRCHGEDPSEVILGEGRDFRKFIQVQF